MTDNELLATALEVDATSPPEWHYETEVSSFEHIDPAHALWLRRMAATRTPIGTMIKESRLLIRLRDGDPLPRPGAEWDALAADARAALGDDALPCAIHERATRKWWGLPDTPSDMASMCSAVLAKAAALRSTPTPTPSPPKKDTQ